VTLYVFDTSAFIEAWWETYPPANFPGLWEEIDTLVDAGNLIAPEEVLHELKSGDDDLHDWVKQRSDRIVVPTSRDLMLKVTAILADHPTLTKPGTGRSAADPFVIALAALRGCPVVTKELGGSATKPRIPFVCDQSGIDCLRFLDVIRNEGWTFQR